MQPVSHTPHMPPSRTHSAPPTTTQADGPGKSAQSVGHLAKAAVAVAIEAGHDMPKNAQGIAASAISGGADPATVFAAMVEDAQPEAPEGEAGEPTVQNSQPAEVDSPSTLTDAEAALGLLTEEADPEA